MAGTLKFCFGAALALCGFVLFSAPSEPGKAPAASDLPDAAALQRLARRALLDAAGTRMHTGPVILKEKLADGSYLVDVTLEDGRKVKGRLFRNRKRYRITVDRRDLFSPEKTVVIKKE
ncbi:MAG: hypothetical protein IJU70_07130 [Lentisphaeria bacterium]|nr:hypothetical protein [Lentisphaeria bacterium]